MKRWMGSIVAATLLLGAAACGDDTKAGTPADADSGTTLKLWTRAATESQSKAYAAAYNATHKNQVEVTAYPNEEYPAKLASAAGAKALPDLFASDVVFAPQYASQGLWLDITDKFNALPVKDKVAPAHVRNGTWNKKNYAVPHTVDMSVMLYNKDLFAKAGLDPEKPPTTLQEFADDARAVDKLGGDVNGTYFGGNCGGCNVFTLWPSVWASSGDVMTAEGTESTVNGKAMADVFALYRKLYDEGVAAPASKDEAGPTWLGALQSGKIGIAPGPAAWLGLIEEKAAFKLGIAPISGIDGGESTFVGGDAIGIGATSKHAAQAWDFLAWTLGDEAQVEVVAKNKGVPVRTDLAANKYSSADPRIVTINNLMAKGRTPYAKNFNVTYNDPQSPWVTAFRGALFGDARKSLDDGATALTASLKK
ncbi:sugar ABC transporter substrate-binding protein [Dactylosporangium sp. NPDC005555]|uniref:ABC transporter substrate-binding protein n=1 Tax=Dactylosporangium sp. NPDC005555 TaxID=3154889 RepID=UPI0033AD24A8